MRQLVQIRRLFEYYDSNKLWIISLLYISAILKDYIWYCNFGINIFGFITIQDTFLSFISFTMIISVMSVNIMLFKLVIGERKGIFILIKYLGFLGITIIFYFLFKKPFSFITLIFILIVIYNALSKKDFKSFTYFFIIIIISLSTIEPLIQGATLRNYRKNVPNNQFEWTEGNTEFYSFTFKNELIDTYSEDYFLVGNTPDYFFVYKRSIKKTMIIPKNECENITSQFYFGF